MSRNDKRFWFGVGTSVAWLAVCAILLLAKRSDLAGMPPNAWGDFFAGCFAPLAFLWLVLGYLQQGEELNLSTKALLLQADELRNSVEQQQALVEVSRQQVESEREALQFERQQREAATQPFFVVWQAGATYYADKGLAYRLKVSNSGAMVTNVRVSLIRRGGEERNLATEQLFKQGQELLLDLSSPVPLPANTAELVIRYLDVQSRSHEQVFAVRRETEDNPLSYLVCNRS